jgi:transcriptional regulator with XRE-family HTH domain
MVQQAPAAGQVVKPEGTAGQPIPAALAHRGGRSVKAEVDAARERMRGMGFGYAEIAAELSRRYRLRPRKAYRVAYGWTLDQAAARFNARAAGETTGPQPPANMTSSHLCEYEQWPFGGRRPFVYILLVLAKVYDTDVSCLLDFADHENISPADRMTLLREPPADDGGFGDELRRLLAARGWSQRKLAHQVPCDAGFLSRLIRGHKPPSRKMAARLDELLGADGRLIAHVRERDASAKRDRRPRTASASPQGAGGISVTLPYVPGRLVIEVSGLDAASAEAGDAPNERALRLVPADHDSAGRERGRAG